jgi:hypothetical protein
MAKSIAPESREKEYNFQQTKLAAKIVGDYEEVNLLDFVFCNSMVLISDRKNPLRDPHVVIKERMRLLIRNLALIKEKMIHF